MGKITLQNLGSIVRERRGTKGLREMAREIGTSPPTLSRIESGKLPDLNTFGKLCRWLDLDPSEILGVQKSKGLQSDVQIATAHLRAKREISPETAGALAKVIIKAQQMLPDTPEELDGTGF